MPVHCTLSIINEMLLLYLANVTLLSYCPIILGGNRYSIFSFSRDYFIIYRYNKQLRHTCLYIYVVLFSKHICRTYVQIFYSVILHILWNVSIFFLSIYVPWKKRDKACDDSMIRAICVQGYEQKTFSTWHISALIFYSHILSVLT